MKQVIHFLRQAVVKLPFTLTLLITVGGVALLTDSHNGRLHPAWLQRLGFAAQDMAAGRWERLFSSAVTTHGGSVFWQAMGMTAVAVGTAEWLTGSKRTALTFWGIHLLTLSLESSLVTPFLHQFANVDALQVARDVGPSAGYFGCLGLVVWQLPRRWRMAVGLTILAGLLLTLWRPLRVDETAELKLLADVAHLLAFSLGFLSTPFFLPFRRFPREWSVLKGASRW